MLFEEHMPSVRYPCQEDVYGATVPVVSVPIRPLAARLREAPKKVVRDFWESTSLRPRLATPERHPPLSSGTLSVADTTGAFRHRHVGQGVRLLYPCTVNGLAL